jgi:glucose/arabinose dehydrogenase
MVNQFTRTFFLIIWANFASATPEPILDPIPARIQPGDIVVGVVNFVRVPKTVDSSDQEINDAHARIQYLQPFGNTFGKLVVNDTRGLLYLTDDRGTEPEIYLDLRTADVGFDDTLFPNEMGLSGVAFHPEFTSIGKPGFGKFYTAYSTASDSGVANYLDDDAGSHESVVREWTAFNPRARTFEGTSREIFRIGQFASNHNIGHIAFNPVAEVGTPDYGVLYVTFGDGGAANDPRRYGQNLTVPLSTIMRISPLEATPEAAYGIPADNPFIDHPSAAPEIWVYGLRNAQHFSWDSQGRMFITDIGQRMIEEINLGISGANYGWRLREGTFATAFGVADGEPGRVYPLPDRDPGFTYPIAQYDHDEGRAIGSGYLYEGTAIPELVGKFVFADLVDGRIFYIDAKDAAPGHLKEIKELRLVHEGREQPLKAFSSFANSYDAGVRVDARLGIDALGELYVVTKGDGWIRKLVALP